jgi:hypothetical protein
MCCSTPFFMSYGCKFNSSSNYCKRLETDNAGGYAGRYWDNLGGAQSMVKDGARTWNDFLVACTAKFPSNRRMAKVEEKVVVGEDDTTVMPVM